MSCTLSLERKNKVTAFLFAGVWFATFVAVANLIGYWVANYLNNLPADYSFRTLIFLILCPVTATFICGGVFARIILRFDRCRSGRAIRRGMLTVFCAFLLNLYLSLITLWLISVFESNDVVVNAPNWIDRFIIMTFSGVIIGGMVSPLGGLIGWLLHKLVRRPLRKTTSTAVAP